jgi:putative ABC transport system permease protein
MRNIGESLVLFALSPFVQMKGTLLGLFSAGVAIPISYPVSRWFTDALGNQLFKFPLDFRYSFGGLALWLIVVMALSALASLWPAWRAARTSVRETLAYE